MSVQRTVTSQSELDAAIAGAVPLIIIDSPSTVWLTIRDLGSSSAELWGSSSAVLRESSSAELRESSSAELRESSSAVLRESSSAVLWESSSAVLRGSSSAELRGSSRAELWESSSAVLRESSSAVLWGSSSAVLRGSSSAVLRGSSSAVLWGSSRAVLATGTSSVHMHGSAALAKAGPRTAVFRHSHEASIAEGGVLIDCTEPNTELLQTTLGQIEAHPEQWNQSQWVSTTDCGTAYCFAGWAAQLSGAVDVVTNDNARGIAASELNLADSDAERLFAAGNTLDDLRREVARLINPVAVSS